MKPAKASRQLDEAASWMLLLPMLTPGTLTSAGIIFTANVYAVWGDCTRR